MPLLMGCRPLQETMREEVDEVCDMLHAYPQRDLGALLWREDTMRDKGCAP